jgi:hypothetical protein
MLGDSVMPRFHLHLRNGQLIECGDEEGAEFGSLEEAYLEAFHGAQELCPIFLQERRDPRRYTYEITNPAGEVLIELPFSELLDTCRDARKSRAGPAIFDRQLFLKIVENAEAVNRKCLEVREALLLARRSLDDLKRLQTAVTF